MRSQAGTSATHLTQPFPTPCKHKSLSLPALSSARRFTEKLEKHIERNLVCAYKGPSLSKLGTAARGRLLKLTRA